LTRLQGLFSSLQGKEKTQSHIVAEPLTTAEPPSVRHMAIIMDGNGRWASKRHLPRLAGHSAGVAALRRVVECASDEHIEMLSVYAFSTENWAAVKSVGTQRETG